MIPVLPFDPRQLPPDSSGILYGIRRTGKSYFLRWHFYHWRDFYDQVGALFLIKENETHLSLEGIRVYQDEAQWVLVGALLFPLLPGD